MSAQRRLGVRDSEVRARLLESAIEIVEKDGCSALTIGTLAKTIGLTRQSVHYYFGTIEDIFIEILRSQKDEVKNRALESLDSDNPLRAIWSFRRATSVFASEIIAMALRSEKIRKELTQVMEELASISISVIEKFAKKESIALPFPPAMIATVLTSVSYQIALGKELGMTIGHQMTIDAIEEWLSKLETDWKAARAN